MWKYTVVLRYLAAIGLAGAKTPAPLFQRHGLKLSQIKKLFLGEIEVICFGVFVKKLQIL